MQTTPASALLLTPEVDPTPLVDLFRGNFATEIITASVTHFNIFPRLAEGPRDFASLQGQLKLSERAAIVLLTALQSFGLIGRTDKGELSLTKLSLEHLVPGTLFDLSAYIGLAARSPGVHSLIERLTTNRPARAEPEHSGAAYIFKQGMESAMEQEASARSLTLALAGRAKNVAPYLAARIAMDKAKMLLDVGGGTGIYSIACLQKNRGLKAAIWDRPEVLKVAKEMAQTYEVADRMEFIPGDMFADPVPAGADMILLSNVLHDWDVPECVTLINRCAQSLPAGGRLLVHDVFLNDALDGPAPIALYSAALFCLTEGRAYSASEYRRWLSSAGLSPQPIVPTLIHCGVLPAVKS